MTHSSTNSSRRTFLKSAAALAAAAAIRAEARTMQLPIGLQLYSVRNLLPKDFDGTLAQVHAAGYTVVEAAGYFNRTAKEFRASMDKAGLRCVSTHHPLKQLNTEFDHCIDYAHTLGLEYIICSSSLGLHGSPGTNEAPTLADWHRVADDFNRLGQKVKAAGMTFGVHNHMPEFAVVEGRLVYDQLLARTDPQYVVFEIDAGWVAASGHDPVAYLRRAPQRFPLMHVKDMIKGPSGQMHATEMGRGAVHYGRILRAATGLKYYFIEQEEFDIDPMQALRLDAEYMRTLNV